MAEQKFLGQEGTDVLVEKIKEPLIDKYLAPFNKYKDSNMLIADTNDHIVDLNADLYAALWMLTWGFQNFGYVFWTEMNMGDVDWSQNNTVGELFTQFLNRIHSTYVVDNTNTPMSYYDLFKDSDLMTNLFFSPFGDSGSSTSIEEITAQEVSDKFNS